MADKTTVGPAALRDPLLRALVRIADAYSNNPASRQILTPLTVGGRRLLAIRTGSFLDGRVTIVRNVVINGTLLRHAERLLVRDSRGNPAVIHRSSVRGVTHVHAVTADQPLLVRVFAHHVGARDALDEYEHMGSFDGTWSSLTSDEYSDALAGLAEVER